MVLHKAFLEVANIRKSETLALMDKLALLLYRHGFSTITHYSRGRALAKHLSALSKKTSYNL
jgi:hypothetical protein